MKNFVKEISKIVVLGLVLIVIQAFAFTEPTQAPPGGNVPAPLNVGSSGQSKAGGLILNTGGAANGLIVDQGSVGIGTQSPTQKLDVIGYIRGATGLCIGGDCRTAWPSFWKNVSLSSTAPFDYRCAYHAVVTFNGRPIGMTGPLVDSALGSYIMLSEVNMRATFQIFASDKTKDATGRLVQAIYESCPPGVSGIGQ